MAKKKSQAQLRRLQERAAARGEAYVPPPVEEETRDEENASSDRNDPPKEEGQSGDDDHKKDQQWLETAQRLEKELKEIDESADLPSKARRSAKRKAEAVAGEDVGVPASELMEWYEKHQKSQQTKKQNSTTKPPVKDEETSKREAIADKLKKELEGIDGNEEIKAKDRRSAKRKAEAIAAEEAGMPAQELLDWYETFLKSQPGKAPVTNKKNHDPYIAFVGQLSYETTQDELFQHIQEQLKNDFKVKKKDVKIRILTDSKTKKSRGMAFIEVEDPELLYGLLKLHQTFLNGRRVNIERSAGGKKNSETRKTKLSQYRKEQEAYFAEVVDSIMKEYRDTGELREGELDEGVIALCKRHAGPVVRAAVAEYMEKGGRDMDNPSAYLTFLVTKFATEGIREDKEESNTATKKKMSQPKRKGGNGGSSGGDKKRFKQSSEFVQAGVDMSMSNSKGGNNLTRVFPSARRGRGRGYM